MKTILAGIAVLTITTFVAEARFIRGLSYRQLYQKSDLIVVARLISTEETEEVTDLPHIGPPTAGRGLSSEFEVSTVLKGDNGIKKLVMHHYRLANPDISMLNGPALLNFSPGEPTSYLLFLRREPDGRYAPLDQTDPALTCVLKLSASEWSKMKSDDFKKWLDAKKWLDERANPGRELSPEIPPDGAGEGSLHEAALNGKLEKAKALIKGNPALVFDQRSYAAQTPLHLAVQYGNIDVAKLLLANGADVEAKAHGAWTPLLNAVFGGNTAAVEVLLAHNANINEKEDAGRTPLHVAAENGYTEIARILLAHKAEVSVRNNDGTTPLHIAAAMGAKDMVLLLLGNNADINAKDNKGKTPLDLALAANHPEVAEILRLRRHDRPE